MYTIFGKEDFRLCNVPVPRGYLQSQTHSGVFLYDGKYYLTTSPFPSYKEARYIIYLKALIRKLSGGAYFPLLRAEEFENPCLYVQESDAEFPISFKLMQQRPIMDTPEDYYGLPAFNSDPDIFIEEGKIYILNRTVYRTKLCPGEPLNKYENRIYIVSGDIDGDRFKLERILRLQSNENRMLASPCFFRYNNEYYLLELETNAYNDGKSFDGIYRASSNRMEGLKDNNDWYKININNNCGFLPWHMSTFQYDGKLFSIIACVKKGESHRCWQLLGEFNENLSELKIFNTPLTDYKSYRGSALVNNEGEFVLYNTTVHEKIKGGKSVDGREIIMAHAPFEKILKRLK